MRDAAQRLVGEHDFRNFCKLDPSKQIENYSRRVVAAWIERVERDWPTPGQRQEEEQTREEPEDEMYVFNLRGTAFLWHQVRCIVAILFLIGQRLEQPSLIDHMLHTKTTSSKSFILPESPPIESKPNYTLADGLPLVLWDCGYKPEDVTWQTDGQLETQAGTLTDRERTHNFWFQLYSLWTHDRIQTTMQHYFLRAAQVFYPPPSDSGLPDLGHEENVTRTTAVKINTGGGTFRHMTKYVPVLELDRGELAEVANQKWRDGAAGKRRLAKRGAKKGQGVLEADMVNE
ncbi:tRNA pseudouridine synthase [Ceratobasidium sp. AG-Ba]|nr:tRNA pseudouridine synthase [Ceratobasidium sp. AG-Ba]